MGKSVVLMNAERVGRGGCQTKRVKKKKKTRGYLWTVDETEEVT